MRGLFSFICVLSFFGISSAMRKALQKRRACENANTDKAEPPGCKGRRPAPAALFSLFPFPPSTPRPRRRFYRSFFVRESALRSARKIAPGVPRRGTSFSCRRGARKKITAKRKTHAKVNKS